MEEGHSDQTTRPNRGRRSRIGSRGVSRGGPRGGNTYQYHNETPLNENHMECHNARSRRFYNQGRYRGRFGNRTRNEKSETNKTNGDSTEKIANPNTGRNIPSRNNKRNQTPTDSTKSMESHQMHNEINNLASSVSKLITKRSNFLKNADQRVVLIDKIRKNKLECCICMDKIKAQNPIWNCENCYNLLHLKCAKEWSRSTMNKSVGSNQAPQEGWRCPYCQNSESKLPHRYYCFCGRDENPSFGYGTTPHSCDQPCSRLRRCNHKCPILCHPGPCPPCESSEKLKCSCGKTEAFVKCGLKLKCTNVCNKLLSCEQHYCEEQCHDFSRSCAPCNKPSITNCICERFSKAVLCDSQQIYWKCDEVCNELLDCQNHRCQEVCHDRECGPCLLKPDLITSCHCGKEQIPIGARKSCLDKIPICENSCERPLICGHPCQSKCHAGECTACPVVIDVTCFCEYDTVKITCGNFILDTSAAKCTRQCKKKMSCGRHSCSIICCQDRTNRAEGTHICTKVCNKKLDCQLHQCEQQCHRGSCRRCPNVSFDELRCHCDASVVYPPVYCGTNPPECAELCTKMHACDHDVFHNCHSDSVCPPCPVLMEKRCNCGRSVRNAIPCFQNNVSCGQECSGELSCGHSCVRTCHVGPCRPDDFVCHQLCSKPRPNCSHTCGQKCHDSSCEPFDPCRCVIVLHCPCGRRKQKVTCEKYEKMIEHHKRAAQKSGRSECITSLAMNIECDGECLVQERNRKIAAALDIEAPTISSEPDIIYPESVIRFAQDKPNLAVYVEANLRRMALQLEETNEKKVEYKLHSMNKRERMFVHELSDLYNIYSVGRDIEPNRYIVLIADKGKSKIPPNALVKMLRKNYGLKLNTNEAFMNIRQGQLPSSKKARE